MKQNLHLCEIARRRNSSSPAKQIPQQESRSTIVDKDSRQNLRDGAAEPHLTIYGNDPARAQALRQTWQPVKIAAGGTHCNNWQKTIPLHQIQRGRPATLLLVKR